MLLHLSVDHKKHLLFLTEQTPQVLQDFCKLALDYLQKGPNLKLYGAAAQKLEVEADVVKGTVEGLANLLLEGCKYKLSGEVFRDSIIALGFTKEKEAILCKLYGAEESKISEALSSVGLKLPRYHDMEWRFEVQEMERFVTTNIRNAMLDSLIAATMPPAERIGAGQGPQFARQWRSYTNQTVVDKVPPEMLHLVDPHWYQFAPLDPYWHKILGLVMIVLGLMGWLGNGVVVYVFSMTRSLRTPSNLLVVNLAFSDFLMMIIMSPPMVINCYYETWVLGTLMCDIYAMVGSLCGCASIWTMTAIALDRYNVIVKGMSGTPLTIKRSLFQISFIWLFALLWTILPVVGWNRYVPEGNMTSCGTDYLTKDWGSRSYILVYSVFVYYLPLFVIIYSYYFIVSTVSAHEKGMREQAKRMNVASLRSGENQAASAEAKLARVALTTIGLWFMAWTPYLVINYMGIFGGAYISPLFTIWGSLFAKANAIYNPIVYGISHPKYRAALKEKLPFLVCGETDNSPAVAKTLDTASAGTTDGKA